MLKAASTVRLQAAAPGWATTRGRRGMAEEFPAESQDVLHIEVFSPGARHALCTESQGTAAHTPVAWRRAFWGGQWRLEKEQEAGCSPCARSAKGGQGGCAPCRRTHQHGERAAEPRGSVRVVFPEPGLWETSGLAQRKSWDTRSL